MSWTRYLLHDFWTAREFNELEASQRSSRRSARQHRSNAARARKELQERIEELEQDLGEATLLLRTLADLCVEEGVLTAEQLQAKAKELDALDGVIDGRMGRPVDGAGSGDED